MSSGCDKMAEGRNGRIGQTGSSSVVYLEEFHCCNLG